MVKYQNRKGVNTMDENKNDLMQNEAEESSLQANAANEAPVQETVEIAQGGETAESTQDTDNTFGAERVESEAALSDLLSGEQGDDAQGEGDEQTEAEEETEEMALATYAADCTSCATKVYFEREDLDEEGNLICPNCNEKIEINTDAMDYFLVDKSVKEEQAEESGDMVVDCEHCEAVVHFTEDDIDDDENITCPQCGESIHIETEVLDAYREKDFQKALKKKKILKRVLASIGGVVLALVLCCAVIYFVGNKSVVKVDGTSVPMNVYKAVYQIEIASNYVNGGYNTDEKASKQAYTESDDFETWDDFFKAQTADSLKLYYGIYNEAKAENYEMTDKDTESVDKAIDSIKEYADSSNLSFEDYLNTNYGLKQSEKEFREYLELTAYVQSYFQHVMSKDITKKQLEEIYKANPSEYQVVSFRYFYLQVDDKLSKEEALKRVEAVSKAKTEKEFKALVLKNVDKKDAEGYQKEEATLLKDMVCSRIADRPVAKLLNDEKAKKGETIFGLSEDGTYAEAAMLLEPKHKSDELIEQAAIGQVSSKKGQDYLNKFRKNVTVKSSLGMILRNLTF